MINDDDTAWMREDRDHIYRLEQEKTRQTSIKAETRKEIAGYITVLLGIVLVVGIIAGTVWTTVQRSNATKAQQIADCTRAGGTMFNLASGGPVCLFLKDGEPQ